MTTELLTDPGHLRSDLQMITTAIRRGYDIPDELIAALPKVAGSLMLDKNQKGQVRLKAIDALMAMKAADDRAKGIDKPQGPPPQTTVNVGVKIENNSNAGTSLAREVLEQLRLDGVPERISE